MKKIFIIIFLFISVIMFCAAFTYSPQPKFKNLKILSKDISKQDLDSIMHNYSLSLNVKCDFCHVHNEEKKTWDMASDGNPYKLIARKMMLMTNGINKNYFKPATKDKDITRQTIQSITCYTCHKGEAIPVSFPEVIEEKEN